MAEPIKPTESESTATASISEPPTQKPPEAAIDDDSDPDFDDLDDVLDQFSEAKATQQHQQKSQPVAPAPTSSGPGRPPTTSALPPDLSIPHGPDANETEDEFMKRLTGELSSVMSQLSTDPAASAEATPEDLAKMGRQLEEFTQKMEAEGIQPEDLLKAILGEDVGTKVGDMAHKEHDRRESESQSRSKSKSKSQSPETSRAATAADERPTSSSSTNASKAQQSTSFEDTIRRTMARMSESSAAATSATTAQQKQKSEEDLLADMLRALETEGGEGGQDDSELSKMFLGMMEQLTNKDMLYEPMKELSEKFPTWLKENKPSPTNKKLSQQDFERFTRQEKIVQEIVAKFEAKNYSDDDPKCREFIWEKMQEMQGRGRPARGFDSESASRDGHGRVNGGSRGRSRRRMSDAVESRGPRTREP